MTYQIERNCTGDRMQPFGIIRDYPRSSEVTKGHKRSKKFKIGQMTNQIEGNCTGDRMQQFFEVTQGHQGSHKVTKGQTTRWASTTGPNWPEGPVSQD